MKKLLSILLILALLPALTLTAAAEGETPAQPENSVAFEGVTITATGCSAAPGADGTPRLTLFLTAENRGDTAGTLRCLSCTLGPCELPASFCLALGPGESADAELVVPLTALRFLLDAGAWLDFARLRFSFAGETGSVQSGWLRVRVESPADLTAEAAADEELFARFGARVRTLGASCDGSYLTAWLLLENNNDFPLRLEADGEAEAPFALCGGSVQAHSSAAVRVDIPLDRAIRAVSFTLGCTLSGYADGVDNAPVKMAELRLPLRLEETEGGRWTITAYGDCEADYDQSYIARVGMREFRYDECLPIFEIDPDQPVLPQRESGLSALACCAGYELLRGMTEPSERGEDLVELPLMLRSFTGEALALTLRPGERALWLPCLTDGALRTEANGGAGARYVFSVGGLRYPELADAEPTWGFTAQISAAEDPAQSRGAAAVELAYPAGELKAAESAGFEDFALGELTFRLLGLELRDGFSLWLLARNETDGDLSFGEKRSGAMFNSAMIDLLNTGTQIPAHTECLVLLRGAVFGEDGAPDPFAFKTPQLWELNTLKLRLGTEEAPATMTLMFQDNGRVLFAALT